MGGWGSGRRWRLTCKVATADLWQIDVRRLHREGYLSTGRSFGWQWTQGGAVQASIRVRVAVDHVVLAYRQRTAGADWKEEEYPVRLTWTPCHFGGRRPWFLCPVRGCGRRVAMLYCGGIFACRYCHGLAYPSQRETADDRSIRRAERIRKRLGWAPGILNHESGRPRGMHWQTYFRLRMDHHRWVTASLAGMLRKMEGLQARVQGLLDTEEGLPRTIPL